jgi:hypothetical protein
MDGALITTAEEVRQSEEAISKRKAVQLFRSTIDFRF